MTHEEWTKLHLRHAELHLELRRSRLMQGGTGAKTVAERQAEREGSNVAHPRESMHELQRLADRVCVLILSSDLPAIDIEIRKTRSVSDAWNSTQTEKNSTKWSTKAASSACGTSFEGSQRTCSFLQKDRLALLSDRRLPS